MKETVFKAQVKETRVKQHKIFRDYLSVTANLKFAVSLQIIPRVIFKNVLRFCTDLYASDVFVLRQKTGQSLDICE